MSAYSATNPIYLHFSELGRYPKIDHIDDNEWLKKLDEDYNLTPKPFKSDIISKTIKDEENNTSTKQFGMMINLFSGEKVFVTNKDSFTRRVNKKKKEEVNLIGPVKVVGAKNTLYKEGFGNYISGGLEMVPRTGIARNLKK